MKSGGMVSYNVYTQPPENIRSQLIKYGLNVEELERNDKVRIVDWYTATLGLKSLEKRAFDSLKVADISISFAKEQLRGPPLLDRLRISDNVSVFDRFNEERRWVEFLLTRGIPMSSLRKLTTLFGIVRGIHSDWAYKNLETAVDGIVDFRLDESSDVARNFIRIRSMRDMGFDARWHPLKIQENFKVTIEK